MGKKVYAGNISFRATEEDIRELFSGAGEVESINMITDAHTGQPKGFCFIEMASDADAKKAIESLNGAMFMERTLTVSEARPQKPRENRGGPGGGRGFGGPGGGRGGFGGGGHAPGRGRR